MSRIPPYPLGSYLRRRRSVRWIRTSTQHRVDDFVGELTFQNHLIHALCETQTLNTQNRNRAKRRAPHPKFFDEQLAYAVAAIDYLRGSVN